MTHILSISSFVKKSSNNSCGNWLLSKTSWFVPCIQLLLYRTTNVFLIGCFTFFCDLKIKWKWDSGLNYDSDKAKRHVQKCEQCCVTSCQQDLRLTKMHIPLILYSSLKVHQLKDLLLPLQLQHLTNIATWCTKINSSTS